MCWAEFIDASAPSLRAKRSDREAAQEGLDCSDGDGVCQICFLIVAIRGSSQFDDLVDLPDQTHIRSSREATAPGFRLRREGSTGRNHSSLRHLKPSNPSVRPPGSAETDPASADGVTLVLCWCDRGGIDHVAVDSILLQHPVQPEPDKARLMNGHGQSDPVRCLALRWRSANRVNKPPTSPAFSLYCDIRSPLPGVNDVTNQLERLSSKEINCAKLRADSDRFKVTMIVQHRSSSESGFEATSVWRQTRPHSTLMESSLRSSQ
jgi:hypothetical protein